MTMSKQGRNYSGTLILGIFAIIYGILSTLKIIPNQNPTYEQVGPFILLIGIIIIVYDLFLRKK
jgi:uncharacterized membrane protein HdeD (DUF308 family)